MFKMTPNILRNFLTKRATRRYPYVVRPPFENVRGELYIDIENCTFCTVCAVKCPSECITVDKKSATWACDPFSCVYCGTCADVCPTKCLHQKVDYRPAVLKPGIILMKGKIKEEIKKGI